MSGPYKKTTDNSVTSWIKKDFMNDERIKKYVVDDKYWPFWKYGGAVFLCIYLVFGYGAQLICNLIAFIYPAYQSLKALETKSPEDDSRWLTYWVVFSLFSVSEFFSDLLLSWFPIYWLTKCAFLIWCFLPIKANGSSFIYNSFIRPYFIKHESDIDAALNKVTNKVTKTVADHFSNEAKI